MSFEESLNPDEERSALAPVPLPCSSRKFKKAQKKEKKLCNNMAFVRLNGSDTEDEGDTLKTQISRPPPLPPRQSASKATGSNNDQVIYAVLAHRESKTRYIPSDEPIPQFEINFGHPLITGFCAPGKVFHGSIVIHIKYCKKDEPVVIEGLFVALKKTVETTDVELLINLQQDLHELTNCKESNEKHKHYLNRGKHVINFSIQIPLNYQFVMVWMEAYVLGNFDEHTLPKTVMPIIGHVSYELEPMKGSEYADFLKPQELNISEKLTNSFLLACIEADCIDIPVERINFKFKIARWGFLPGLRIFITAKISNDSSKTIFVTSVDVWEQDNKNKHTKLQVEKLLLPKVKSYSSEQFEMSIRLPQNLKFTVDSNHYLKFNVLSSGGRFQYFLPICIRHVIQYDVVRKNLI